VIGGRGSTLPGSGNLVDIFIRTALWLPDNPSYTDHRLLAPYLYKCEIELFLVDRFVAVDVHHAEIVFDKI